MKTLLLLATLLLTTPALAATPTAPPAPPAPSSHDVYRLDFELTTTQPGKPATTIAFSLNLEQHRKGEVTVGKTVALAGSGGAAGAPLRQNVGTHVMADFAHTRRPNFVPPPLDLFQSNGEHLFIESV